MYASQSRDGKLQCVDGFLMYNFFLSNIFFNVRAHPVIRNLKSSFMIQIFLRKEGSHLNLALWRKTKGLTSGSDDSFVVYFLWLMPAAAVSLPPYKITYF